MIEVQVIVKAVLTVVQELLTQDVLAGANQTEGGLPDASDEHILGFDTGNAVLCEAAQVLLQIDGAEASQAPGTSPTLPLLAGGPADNLRPSPCDSGQSTRGLTPRGSLECNPEIHAFPGEYHFLALFRN